MAQFLRFSTFAKCRQGAVAVEFALVAPIFLALLFGVIVFSTLTTTYSAVQQLAAEGARSSVAGLSNTERDSLARSFVSANAGSYPFLNPAKLTVSTLPITGTPAAFKVTVAYDMSGSFIFAFSNLVPFPSPHISRSAVVQASS